MALAGGLAALVQLDWIDAWIALVVLGVWIAKDAALYPLLRSAYDRPPPTGVEAMVGKRGRTQERLAPRGLVRIGGELWKAEIPAGEPAIERGSDVHVTGHDGTRLHVACAGDEEARQRHAPPSPRRERPRDGT